MHQASSAVGEMRAPVVAQHGDGQAALLQDGNGAAEGVGGVLVDLLGPDDQEPPPHQLGVRVERWTTGPSLRDRCRFPARARVQCGVVGHDPAVGADRRVVRHARPRDRAGKRFSRGRPGVAGVRSSDVHAREEASVAW